MRSGELRSRVRIEARGASQSKYSSGAEPFSAIAADRPAKIAPLKGGEEVIAGRLQGVSVYEITVRDEAAFAAASTAWRIVDERTGEIFNIKHTANHDQRGRWRVFTCEAGATAKGD